MKAPEPEGNETSKYKRYHSVLLVVKRKKIYKLYGEPIRFPSKLFLAG